MNFFKVCSLQIMEEKEALRNRDPGNPNWEFLQMILDYKDQLEFNPLQDGDPLSDHQITVAVRKRPMSQKEVKKKEVDVVTCPVKDQVDLSIYPYIHLIYLSILAIDLSI